MRDLKAVSWHRKKLEYTHILAKYTPQRQKTLTELVWRHELTNIVDLVEKYGFSGDLGIFVIRQVQDRIMTGGTQ